MKASEKITNPGTYAVTFSEGGRVVIATVYRGGYADNDDAQTLLMTQPHWGLPKYLEHIEIAWCADLTETMRRQAVVNLPTFAPNHRLRAYYLPHERFPLEEAQARAKRFWTGVPSVSLEEIPDGGSWDTTSLDPDRGQVWLDPKGVKRVLNEETVPIVREDGRSWTFVCATPHLDGDYSYQCGWPSCRCVSEPQ